MPKKLDPEQIASASTDWTLPNLGASVIGADKTLKDVIEAIDSKLGSVDIGSGTITPAMLAAGFQVTAEMIPAGMITAAMIQSGTLGQADTYFDITKVESRFPVGSIVAYAGSTPPTGGWLLCDGSTYVNTAYPLLASVLGVGAATLFGDKSSTGLTYFNVPDLRGRTVIGVGPGASLTERLVGDSMGTETHSLSTAELAEHSHKLEARRPNSHVGTYQPQNVYTDQNVLYDMYRTGDDNKEYFETSLDTTHKPTYSGGGTAHNNMQPSLAINYVIKADPPPTAGIPGLLLPAADATGQSRTSGDFSWEPVTDSTSYLWELYLKQRQTVGGVSSDGFDDGAAHPLPHADAIDAVNANMMTFTGNTITVKLHASNDFSSEPCRYGDAAAVAAGTADITDGQALKIRKAQQVGGEDVWVDANIKTITGSSGSRTIQFDVNEVITPGADGMKDGSGHVHTTAGTGPASEVVPKDYFDCNTGASHVTSLFDIAVYLTRGDAMQTVERVDSSGTITYTPGLQALQFFEWRVAAKDSAGTGTFSGYRSFKTTT